MENTEFKILLLAGESDFDEIETFQDHDKLIEKFDDIVKDDIRSKIALKEYETEDEELCIKENYDKYKVGIYRTDEETDNEPASILDFDKFQTYIENVNKEIERIKEEEAIEENTEEEEQK